MSSSMANRDLHGHESGENNTEHSSHRPGTMRRAIAKVKNSTGLSHDSKASYVDYQDDGPHPHPHPHPHPKVEDLVNTVGYSLIQEIMQYLKGPDGEAAMSNIFTTQGQVAARLASTNEAKRATRIAAQEAMTGTYDGMERKTQEMISKIPSSLRMVGTVVLGFYALLLAVGVLFSLWRFALFGLQ